MAEKAGTIVDELNNLYCKKGILSNSDVRELLKVCPFVNSCWDGLPENRRKNESPILQLPWVGKYYQQGWLVAIGVNTNQVEGPPEKQYRQLYDEVEGARKEIREGRKRVFKQPGYQGTLLYHRLAANSVLLLNSRAGLSLGNSGNDWPSPLVLAQSFDYIAYLQHVKCSPKGDGNRNYPQGKMWKNCEQEFLWDELSVLKPDIVLAIGNENYEKIEEMYRGHEYEIKDKHAGKENLVNRACLEKGTQKLWLFGIRHPAASRAKEVFEELFILETS